MRTLLLSLIAACSAGPPLCSQVGCPLRPSGSRWERTYCHGPDCFCPDGYGGAAECVPDKDTGPELLPAADPIDPGAAQVRTRPECDRLAAVPSTGYPPTCCSWYCIVESSGGSAGDLEWTMEAQGCVRGHQCADFVCPLRGGGDLDFGVCVP